MPPRLLSLEEEILTCLDVDRLEEILLELTEQVSMQEEFLSLAEAVNKHSGVEREAVEMTRRLVDTVLQQMLTANAIAEAERENAEELERQREAEKQALIDQNQRWERLIFKHKQEREARARIKLLGSEYEKKRIEEERARKEKEKEEAEAWLAQECWETEQSLQRKLNALEKTREESNWASTGGRRAVTTKQLEDAQAWFEKWKKENPVPEDLQSRLAIEQMVRRELGFGTAVQNSSSSSSQQSFWLSEEAAALEPGHTIRQIVVSEQDEEEDQLCNKKNK